MTDFHFLRPLWLFALLALPLFWYYWQQGQTRAGTWAQVCEPALLKALLQQQDLSPRRAGGVWLLMLLFILTCLTLAGPSWEQQNRPVYKTQQARVFILDLSRSMDASDLKPSRLQQARYKLIDMLQQDFTGQTGLIVFAGDAHVVTPLTPDANTIVALINSFDSSVPPTQGSRVDLALSRALKLLEDGQGGQGDVILITDGFSDKAASLEAATKLKTAGFRLWVWGVGTAVGAPVPLADGSFLKDSNQAIVLPKLERAGLQTLATTGGGRYLDLSADNRDIQTLTQWLFQQAEANAQIETDNNPETRAWLDQGYWLLIPLVLLASLGFRKGWVFALALLYLPVPPVEAAWQDLWQTSDQQGAEALATDKPEEAAELFADPQWRATAQYRAGDYAAAAKTFEGIDTAEGHYNRGNALAKQGELEQALSAYEQSLQYEQPPKQVQENLEKVKQILAQQKQQQQNQQGDKGEQGEQGEKGEQDKQDSSQQEQQSDQSQQQEGDNSQGQGNESQSTDDNSGEQQAQSESQQESDETRDSQSTETSQTSQADDKEAIKEALAKQAQEDTNEAQEQGEEQQAQAANAELSPEAINDREQAQALEQVLEALPEDPGTIWRRKFYYQNQKQAPSRSRSADTKAW